MVNQFLTSNIHMNKIFYFVSENAVSQYNIAAMKIVNPKIQNVNFNFPKLSLSLL